MVHFRQLAALSVGAFVLMIIGCGPTHHQPSGKLMKGGSEFKPNDKAVVQIALYPEADKGFGDAHAIEWEKGTGNFKVVGKTRTGVPAGKYILSVVIYDPYTGPESKDVLGGAMAREKGMPVEIKDNSEIKVDLK